MAARWLCAGRCYHPFPASNSNTQVHHKPVTIDSRGGLQLCESAHGALSKGLDKGGWRKERRGSHLDVTGATGQVKWVRLWSCGVRLS